MSARRSLRDRLAQARAANYLDLRCTSPGMDGLHVRFRALTADELAETVEARSASKHGGIDTAIQVLSWTCVAVWEQDGGVGVSPVEGFDGKIDLASGVMTGKLPTFADPELGAALGCTEQTAAAAIRALLAPNSDLRLVPYGDRVFDWSTGANEKLTRDSLGN